MKVSILLTAMVLTAAAWFGWQDHVRMGSARQRQQELENKASHLGLPGTPGGRSGPREAADAKSLAAELAATDDMSPALLAKAGRHLPLIDREGMKAFVAALLSSATLDSTGQGKRVIALMTGPLTDKPETAILLFDSYMEAAGKLDEREATGILPTLLEKWAARDPVATLAWLRNKWMTYPEIIRGAAKTKVLTVVAAEDPERAFRAMDSLGIREPQDAVAAMMRGGTTGGQRLSVLSALRGHLAGISDGRLRKERTEAAMSAFAASTVSGGEASARQWIASAGFSPMEADAFAAGIAKSTLHSPDETGRWIAFLADAGGETFPAQPVREMMEAWTKDDYRAAGQWLTTAKDDRAKQTAVRAYAETVAKYDPTTAEQWALTLPAGEARTATFSRIHSDWPENDAAGKAAFAEQHGIR